MEIPAVDETVDVADPTRALPLMAAFCALMLVLWGAHEASVATVSRLVRVGWWVHDHADQVLEAVDALGGLW